MVAVSGRIPELSFFRSVTLQEGGVAVVKAMTPNSPEPEPEPDLI